MILCSEIEAYRRFGGTFPLVVCKYVPDCTALHRTVLNHSLGCGNLNGHKIKEAFAYHAFLSLSLLLPPHIIICPAFAVFSIHFCSCTVLPSIVSASLSSNLCCPCLSSLLPPPPPPSASFHALPLAAPGNSSLAPAA